MHKMGKLNLDVEVGDTLHIGEAKVAFIVKISRHAGIRYNLQPICLLYIERWIKYCGKIQNLSILLR